jgi:hypothetical protein
VLLAISPHAGLDGQHPLQGSKALLGTVFLVEPDDGQDDDRVFDVAD